MGKRFYKWWMYIKSIVQEYPDIEKKMEDTIISGAELKDWRAVRDAVQITKNIANGENRIKAINLLHWSRTHTLDGAANEIPCDRATVARWQRAFFEEVARNRGIID